MNILIINSVPYGSTGRIAFDIGKAAEKKGHVVKIYTGYSYHPLNEIKENKNVVIGGMIHKLLHTYLARLTGLNGCFSYIYTMKLIGEFKKFHPDIIHLHNLHGWYINIPMLFNYIKKHNIRTIWTLHDCWAFTGHCPHFDMIGCDKWKTCCCECPQYKEYPKSFFDNSKYMYKLKKKWFTNVENLTIVTPSNWLAGLVKQSFLKDYPVKVINNGIDLTIFKPIESEFKKKYSIEDKSILLGVAFGWGVKKGLDIFIELSEKLDDKFQIVLVGTDENTDKKLPKNIISIHRTQNQTELAEIYSAANLFINPTREENYPTVNMESIACGTPVLTFNTGGSPEILTEDTGIVVPKNDIDTMFNQINNMFQNNYFSKEKCINKAKSFNMNDKYNQYVGLYGE